MTAPVGFFSGAPVAQNAVRHWCIVPHYMVQRRMRATGTGAAAHVPASRTMY